MARWHGDLLANFFEILVEWWKDCLEIRSEGDSGAINVDSSGMRAVGKLWARSDAGQSRVSVGSSRAVSQLRGSQPSSARGERSRVSREGWKPHGIRVCGNFLHGANVNIA